MSDAQRVFLVVIDDTDEYRSALRFACLRALHTGGRVALLRAVEPGDFQHWIAVEEVVREERREEAERLLQRIAKTVIELTHKMPVLYVREGHAREELVSLINGEPMISVLVLAAGTGKEGPGPLIQHLMTRPVQSLRIPVTIVPGCLTDTDIDALA